MSDATTDVYDMEDVYDKQISPLIKSIIEICKRHKMPMLATFCYAKGREHDDPDGVSYATTAIPRGERQTPEILEALRIVRGGASCRPRAMAMTMLTCAKDGER